MRFRRPSPAMVVALIALVMSMTGGAIAAVNYAKNAGAVDGYSAVRAKSSNSKAAGKLVATYPGGKLKGKLPFRFLSGAASSGNLERLAASVPKARRGALIIPAPDNSLSEPQRLVDLGLASLSVACFDEQSRPGVENPAVRFYLTNQSGATLAVAHRAGSGRGTVTTLAAGRATSFVVRGQAMVEVQVQSADRATVVQGGARQNGAGGAEGSCSAFATALIT